MKYGNAPYPQEPTTISDWYGRIFQLPISYANQKIEDYKR
jgi:hypothetical protein